jgi:hypothetical protein
VFKGHQDVDLWALLVITVGQCRGRLSHYVPFTWNISVLQIRSPRVTALIPSQVLTELQKMGGGLVHRQMEGGLVLKPAPKMYDEELLRREGLGEIVCVRSNDLFDLYVPKDSLSKAERTRLVQVRVSVSVTCCS